MRDFKASEKTRKRDAGTAARLVAPAILNCHGHTSGAPCSYQQKSRRSAACQRPPTAFLQSKAPLDQGCHHWPCPAVRVAGETREFTSIGHIQRPALQAPATPWLRSGPRCAQLCVRWEHFADAPFRTVSSHQADALENTRNPAHGSPHASSAGASPHHGEGTSEVLRRQRCPYFKATLELSLSNQCATAAWVPVYDLCTSGSTHIHARTLTLKNLSRAYTRPSLSRLRRAYRFAPGRNHACAAAHTHGPLAGSASHRPGWA